MNFEFKFEPLEPLPMRAEDEREDKEIWQPGWKCFCCQDTGKIQPLLVERVIPNYNYDRDRIPVCQLCNKGRNWLHLKELGVIDTRISFDTCRKLDVISREDWKLTTQKLFEMAKKRAENATAEIAQAHNLRKRDRIQEEFILMQKNHGKARGDWKEIKEEEIEGELRE
ncbi:hypothetical protein [Iningainema tapete]|uniref:Uncharacterized protein n=1 Tax=Iningainema tapete BLCC-T55 TaxID=2748662 RepID=A0A8J7C968_9CYAN|nr:hypothetical protein [Iningainema tapete]MBD2770685.1 hypothetical protein [Iningainema tapete BLCC-T55]